MFRQLNKKAVFRFVSLVVVGTFIFSNIASAGIVSSSDLRTNSAKKNGVVENILREPKFSPKSDVLILTRPSPFKLGVASVNPAHIVDDFGVKASVMTAVKLTESGLRGRARGEKDKAKIAGIKDAADAEAKRIYEKAVQEGNIILVVRVSEGFGRDELAESLKANDVIVPDELLGESEEIKKAIEKNLTRYISKGGKEYKIKNAIIDVTEGTNALVTNVDGKKLEDLKDNESGATSVIVISDGRLLGNCPDIYADGIFTLVPKVKKQEFIDKPLDPELTAQDPGKIEELLIRVAEANGIKTGNLEVVLMDRARETQRLAALRGLQKKYPGLEVTTIKDGTVAHSLVATFGRREGKHKVVMTVGGAPEVFLNVAVASLFKDEGALATARIYSKSVNKTAEGKDAQDLSRRYAFDGNEIEELHNLRPDDAEAIISGNKLFTQENVQGDVEGSFSFITNNGVFNIRGVDEEEGKSKVNILRVAEIDGKPAVWISEKIIDPAKDESQNFINAIPINQPLISFINTEAVNAALKGIVEVTPQGVKILDESALRGYLIDQLVYDATFNPDKQVVDLCRKLIKDIAAAQGATLDSVYELYVQKARDPRQWTVPAINIRGMGYNTGRAIFTSAVANNVGPFILEIARSEIGYTGQRPAEFTTSVLAAAIKEGYKGPLYLQGDHFQITAKDYLGSPEKARDYIKGLIREAILAGFYQIDLDMSVLVDWSKPTADEQQKTNYQETALLTAYVRALERELDLDKSGIVVNLGGEIGEIGMGLEKGKERNSSVEDLRAFMSGYLAELKRLGQEVGYELKPITKVAVQTGTKHGGVRDAQGKVTRAKVSFNTLAELGKVAREEYGLAGVVQHGASTLPPDYFTVFAGKSVPEGMAVDETLLNEANKAVLSSNPVVEVHLATAYQDTTLDHKQFPPTLSAQIKTYILEKYPVKTGEDPNKAFVDNRKNAWGPFKVQAWNLPAGIQEAIRVSLKTQFDTVFNNLGVKDSRTMLAEMRDTPGTQPLSPEQLNKILWGEKLAVFADAFPTDINQVLPANVREINSAKGGKVYPILINYESLVKASPAGIMALQNIAEQLGKGNIKLIPHINRDDINPAELEKLLEKDFETVNKKINGGYTGISRDMFAAVVLGTNPGKVSEQVQKITGAPIYQVIGPQSYAKQFEGVIRVILNPADKEKGLSDAISMAKALKLGLELIPVDGKMSDDDVKKIDALFSTDGQGNFSVASGKVTETLQAKADKYTAQAVADLGI